MELAHILHELGTLEMLMRAKGHEKAQATLEISANGRCCVSLRTGDICGGEMKAFPAYGGAYRDWQMAYGKTPDEAFNAAAKEVMRMLLTVEPALAPDFTGPLVLRSAA